MEKMRMYRDRQEITAADLNAAQEYARDSFDHLVHDIATGERRFVGLSVSQTGAAEVTVQPGRLYQSGMVFSLDSAAVLSVFQHIPQVMKRCVAVVAWGQEADSQVEARDFLTDLASGATEPQSVPMRHERLCQINLVGGVEAADPQPPATSTGSLLVAYVFLGSGGIERVVPAVGNRLPSLVGVDARLAGVEVWKSQAQPRIDTLASDVAALGARSDNNNFAMLRRLAAELAQVKERLKLPANAAAWSTDYYVTSAQSETEDPTYSARVEEGVRFPWAMQASAPLALLNPLNTNVRQVSGLLLPAYVDAVRFATGTTSDFDSPLPLGQFTFQQRTMRQGSISKSRIRYGETLTLTAAEVFGDRGYNVAQEIFLVGGQSYQMENRDEVAKGVQQVRLRRVWMDWYDEPYWYAETSTQTVNGGLAAQTFLNAAHGWLTGLDLYFSDVGPVGAVTVALTETDRGLPDLSRTLATATIEPAMLKAYPLATTVAMPPTYLEAGKRYAISLITAGGHRVATVRGASYTQGALFQAVDGTYLQADAGRDLMVAFRYAKFDAARTVVDLTPLSLAGGITDIDLLYSGFSPPTTQAYFEYQVGGVWKSISATTAEPLIGLPPLLPLRLVFVGGADIAPALRLEGSRALVSRPALGFKHVSKARALATPTSRVEVQVVAADWVAAQHTLTAKLKVGSDLVAATTTAETVVDSTTLKRTYTFNLGAPTSSFAIVFEGQAVAATSLFHLVERTDVAF